jgi:hypothetical protein
MAAVVIKDKCCRNCNYTTNRVVDRMTAEELNIINDEVVSELIQQKKKRKKLQNDESWETDDKEEQEEEDDLIIES